MPKFYGSDNFSRDAYGCCPGHDRVFLSVWGTRACETTKRLKRYPKKVARKRARDEAKAWKEGRNE
jgi:hypothetical protein